MKKFNDGDIIIREYKSGRKAIGIFNVHRNIDKFLYLDETFPDYNDGGLMQFSNYGLGQKYIYRFATYYELNNIIKFLTDEYNFYYKNNINSVYNIRFYLTKVINYRNGLRKYKLERLNDVEKG